MGRNQDPVDIPHLYQCAVTLHQQGELTRAINTYCQVLDHFPEAPEVYYNLGLAWFQLDQFAEAVEAYRKAAELCPNDADILYNLGLACKMDGLYDDAEQAYLQALTFSDAPEDILYNLGCCYQDAGAIEQACLVYERLLECSPRHLSALNNLAYLQHLQKNFDKARDLYRRVLELDPERKSARHMYAALSGKEEEAPPPEYIKNLFDQYSERFEESLVRDLEYQTFCILRQSVDYLTAEGKKYEHCLDLGCGTGLAGEAFRSVCTWLSGVDLSENMIRQAERKKLYDALYCTDILEFLGQTDQRYDLIVAADVLPYLGNLEQLFAAAYDRATDDGLFCLSSEGSEEPEWELQLTGRYAHNPDYIEKRAGLNGWSVLERFQANIRKENHAWITGTIFVFGRKPEDSPFAS